MSKKRPVMINNIAMTDKQVETLEGLQKMWDHVGEPQLLPCDDCVMVSVRSEKTGISMCIGIEADGHAHS
tara:strand:+ start:2579 stop:2788 length:210 start_codon:yes stop_codon:yes gene_type:complete